jgi:hypothetical protein
VITVRIVETTGYRKGYARDELTALLARGGYRQARLGALADQELARLVEDDRPVCVEDDLQSEGDVDGANWTVHATGEEGS